MPKFVDIPADKTTQLTTPSESFMLDLLGKPAEQIPEPTNRIENPEINKLMLTADVGPWRVTGMWPAVESLREIMNEIYAVYPETYESLLIPVGGRPEGMLRVRAKDGALTEWSNHSWGIAVDIKINNELDVRYDNKAFPELLQISDIFEKHGWYWGGLYGQRYEDAMHFEVSVEKLNEWKEQGLLKNPAPNLRTAPIAEAVDVTVQPGETIPVRNLFRWWDPDADDQVIKFNIRDRENGGGYLLNDGERMTDNKVYDYQRIEDINKWSFIASQAEGEEKIGFQAIDRRGKNGESVSAVATVTVMKKEEEEEEEEEEEQKPEQIAAPIEDDDEAEEEALPETRQDLGGDTPSNEKPVDDEGEEEIVIDLPPTPPLPDPPSSRPPGFEEPEPTPKPLPGPTPVPPDTRQDLGGNPPSDKVLEPLEPTPMPGPTPTPPPEDEGDDEFDLGDLPPPPPVPPPPPPSFDPPEPAPEPMEEVDEVDEEPEPEPEPEEETEEFEVAADPDPVEEADEPEPEEGLAEPLSMFVELTGSAEPAPEPSCAPDDDACAMAAADAVDWGEATVFDALVV